MSGYDKSPDYGGRLGSLEPVLGIIGFAVLAFLIFSCQGNVRAQQNEIVGVASVNDGDTIAILGTHIRLSGIDAPENDRRCGTTRPGEVAANAMDALVRGRSVRCEANGFDRYGRTVATCFVGHADIGGAMVEQGNARDWPRYSHLR